MEPDRSGMSDVLVFDVNETLLNVRALAPRFEAALGEAALLPQVVRSDVAELAGRSRHPHLRAV